MITKVPSRTDIFILPASLLISLFQGNSKKKPTITLLALLRATKLKQGSTAYAWGRSKKPFQYGIIHRLSQEKSVWCEAPLLILGDYICFQEANRPSK